MVVGRGRPAGRPAWRGTRLADSKLLTPPVREERVYEDVVTRALRRGRWWSSFRPTSWTGAGYVTNIEAMRRALARLELAPGYVLTDGTLPGWVFPGWPCGRATRWRPVSPPASVIAR